MPKISLEFVINIKAWGCSAVGGYAALRMIRPHAPKGRDYARRNPLPKISLEFVINIKAWGSVCFK